MGALAVLFVVLYAACLIASLICWIMVLIKIFKDNVGLGILGIVCSLFAFIYGWVKAAEYGIKKVMLWWTILVVLAIVCIILATVLGGVAAAASGGGM